MVGVAAAARAQAGGVPTTRINHPLDVDVDPVEEVIADLAYEWAG